MAEDEGDIFAAFLSGLDMTLSEKGLESPEMESIEDEPEEIDGSVIKVTFDIHLFMNHRQTRYFMISSNQKLTSLGKMSLKQAILKFNPKQSRKKR